MKSLQLVILLGKSGSGKGTQAALLAKEFRIKHISTGVLLRARCKKNDFLGKKLKSILVRGGLVPTPLVFHIWLHKLESLRKDPKARGVILEGSPRKLYEAWMFKETLEFYEWNNDIRVFDIAISDKEAMKRLLKRGRSIDDETQAIQNRLYWFKKEVKPVISFYKKEGILSHINGEQSVEAVYQDIQKSLGSFLK